MGDLCLVGSGGNRRLNRRRHNRRHPQLSRAGRGRRSHPPHLPRTPATNRWNFPDDDARATRQQPGYLDNQGLLSPAVLSVGEDLDGEAVTVLLTGGRVL